MDPSLILTLTSSSANLAIIRGSLTESTERGNMITEEQILEIAEPLPSSFEYEPFYDLGSGNHNKYLFRVKTVLLKNKYICHESRNSPSWDNCGYTGNKTHFHKPNTLKAASINMR